jgi:hypothetical protein
VYTMPMETTEQSAARVEALAEWLHNRDNPNHRWAHADDLDRRGYLMDARNALWHVDRAAVEPAWPAGKEGRWPR